MRSARIGRRLVWGRGFVEGAGQTKTLGPKGGAWQGARGLRGGGVVWGGGRGLELGGKGVRAWAWSMGRVSSSWAWHVVGVVHGAWPGGSRCLSGGPRGSRPRERGGDTGSRGPERDLCGVLGPGRAAVVGGGVAPLGTSPSRGSSAGGGRSVGTPSMATSCRGGPQRIHVPTAPPAPQTASGREESPAGPWHQCRQGVWGRLSLCPRGGSCPPLPAPFPAPRALPAAGAGLGGNPALHPQLVTKQPPNHH